MYDDHITFYSDHAMSAQEVQRKIKEIQPDPSMDYSSQYFHDERCAIALIVHGLHS